MSGLDALFASVSTAAAFPHEPTIAPFPAEVAELLTQARLQLSANGVLPVFPHGAEVAPAEEMVQRIARVIPEGDWVVESVVTVDARASMALRVEGGVRSLRAVLFTRPSSREGVSWWCAVDAHALPSPEDGRR